MARSLRSSSSSVDLRLSSDDLIVPAARSITRSVSYIHIDELTETPLILSPDDAEKKLELQQQIDEEYPLYDYTIPIDASHQEIIQLVKNFFQHDDLSNISVKKLTGGITNVLYLIEGLSIPKMLLRISGENTEEMIDRDQELRTLVSLASIGVAPNLYGRFNNGLFYGFVEGNAISPEQMKDPSISALIAEHLAYFHAKADVPGIPRVPVLLDTITKWLEVAQSKQTQEIIDALDEIEFSLTKSQGVVSKLRKELEATSLRVCYCHNDLLSGNIIYENNPPESPSVHFIDFEYGGYNYSGFDIANHFCEMMGFELQSEMYPSLEFQLEWLTTYLKAFLIHSQAEIPRDFTSRVEELQGVVARFSVLAHLFWGIWALIQHQYSSNKDFDYLTYAKQRLSAYLKLQ